MKNEFKIGDKIRVYGYSSRGDSFDGVKFLVTDIDRMWVAALWGDLEHKFHFHQCELVERPKQKKRYWIWSFRELNFDGSRAALCKDTVYRDFNGYDSLGKPYHAWYDIWGSMEKIKHESEFIDVEVES